MEPLSNQVAVRASMNIEWSSKPFMINKVIDTTTRIKVEAKVKKYTDFLSRHAEAINSVRNLSGEDLLFAPDIHAFDKPTLPGNFVKTHLCALWLGGAASVLALVAGIKCMRRKLTEEKPTLRDMDVPLNNGETNHYSLYVE